MRAQLFPSLLYFFVQGIIYAVAIRGVTAIVQEHTDSFVWMVLSILTVALLLLYLNIAPRPWTNGPASRTIGRERQKFHVGP